MSDHAQALCLCGHGLTYHTGGVGRCNDLCVDGGGVGSHSCPCSEFSLWDKRSERNEFAKAALTALISTKFMGMEPFSFRCSETASAAFVFADAMLAEAKKRDGAK